MKIICTLTALAFASFAFCSSAIAVDGLIELKSPYNVNATMNRLEEIVKQRDLKVFARIDHAAGAAKISVNQT